MKHVLILRGLGVVLVIALAVNITAVLAAPLYLDPGEDVAQTSSADPQQPESQQPESQQPESQQPESQQPNDSPDDHAAVETADLVIDGDVVQRDSTLEPDPDDRQTVEIDGEAPIDPVDGHEQFSAEPRLAGIMAEESSRAFFELGVQIGSQSRRQPFLSAVRRLLRRRPTETLEVDADLLPTVVIIRDRSNATEAPGSPNIEEDTLPTGTTAERIVLENPVENGYTVRFQLGGTVQSLKPGAMLIEVSNLSVVRFDRGGSFGEFREELRAGSYQFRVSREGWKLEKAKEEAASL